MFKKAKKCNLRRRNESDEEENEENEQQQPVQQQQCGPGANSTNTAAASVTVPGANSLSSHGNGVQTNSIKPPKDKVKQKELKEEAKASLLSFNDEEGKSCSRET